MRQNRAPIHRRSAPGTAAQGAMVSLPLAALLVARAVAAPLSLDDDPALLDALADALARRPEAVAAEARLRSERATAPAAGRLPDPSVQVAVDEGSFADPAMSRGSLMVAQSLPPPGARRAMTEAAAARIGGAEAALARVALSTAAELRRAWLDLLLTEARLALQDRVELYWEQAETLARVGYEAGRAAQSDLLRAQLERDRLRLRRIALAAQAEAQRVAIERLAGPGVRPTLALAELAGPSLPGADQALADALARSP